MLKIKCEIAGHDKWRAIALHGESVVEIAEATDRRVAVKMIRALLPEFADAPAWLNETQEENVTNIVAECVNCFVKVFAEGEIARDAMLEIIGELADIHRVYYRGEVYTGNVRSPAWINFSEIYVDRLSDGG